MRTVRVYLLDINNYNNIYNTNEGNNNELNINRMDNNE